jgi:PAS domain S-box-containing protein
MTDDLTRLVMPPPQAERSRFSSLGSRLTLLAAIFGLLSILVTALVENHFLQRGFGDAERAMASRDHIFGEELIRDEIWRLQAELGSWIPRLSSIEGGMPEVDFFAVVSGQGEILWTGTRGADGVAVASEPDFAASVLLHPERNLKRRLDESGQLSGLLTTPRGLMAVAIRTISASTGGSAASGLAVIGNYLGREWPMRAKTLSRRFDLVSVTLFDVQAKEIPAAVEAMAAELRIDSDGLQTVANDKETFSTYMLKSDLFGSPAAVIEVRTPRRARLIMATARGYIDLTLTCAQVLGVFLLWLALRNLVTKPIGRLTRYVGELYGKDAPAQVPIEGNSEIAHLAHTFRYHFMALQNLLSRNHRLATALEQTAEAVILADENCRIVYANPAYQAHVGRSSEELIGTSLDHENGFGGQTSLFETMRETVAAGSAWTGEVTRAAPGGEKLIEEVSVSPIVGEGDGAMGYVIVKRDVTEKRRLEQQLSRAQKLEAIGQLAAGIAHEINTPIQYISDNIKFVDESFREVTNLIEKIQPLTSGSEPVARSLAEALVAADLDFMLDEVPKALEQSHAGCQRVATIVSAMKDFSHPGTEKSIVNINRAIESAITVASNEWRYIADMEMDLAPDLPEIMCEPGEFNQAILNIVVNAAQAIGDVVGDGSKGKGTISVSTRHVGEQVEIRIADTGNGIPTELHGRIFDPFFTTRPVGSGTGQGLTIVHDVIVNKHSGTIVLESETGHGSAFIIRMPIDRVTAPQQEGQVVPAAAG